MSNKIVTISWLIMIFNGICFADNDPRELIIGKDTELKKAIGRISENPHEKKHSEVKEIISGLFDFQTLGRSVVPKLVWDTCNSALKNDFVQAFRHLVETTSMKNLTIYETDSSWYDRASIDGKNATVKAHLWRKGFENILVYKMQSISGDWKVVDLIINDLSTVRSYREQFTTLFKTKSMSEVIAVLENKIRQTEVQEK